MTAGVAGRTPGDRRCGRGTGSGPAGRAFAGTDRAWTVLVALVVGWIATFSPAGVAPPRPVRLVRLRHGHLRPGRLAARAARPDVRHGPGAADFLGHHVNIDLLLLAPFSRLGAGPGFLNISLQVVSLWAGGRAVVAARPPPVPVGLDRAVFPDRLPGPPVPSSRSCGELFLTRRPGHHPVLFAALVLPGHPGRRGGPSPSSPTPWRGRRTWPCSSCSSAWCWPGGRPSAPLSGRVGAPRRRRGRGRRGVVRHRHPGDPAAGLNHALGPFYDEFFGDLGDSPSAIAETARHRRPTPRRVLHKFVTDARLGPLCPGHRRPVRLHAVGRRRPSPPCSASRVGINLLARTRPLSLYDPPLPLRRPAR